LFLLAAALLCIGYRYLISAVRRVIILGPGASGKSTLAARLGKITGLPVIEADKIFWQPDLAPMGRARWTEVQRQLTNRESWIIEGDLGPYEAARNPATLGRHDHLPGLLSIAMCLESPAPVR
jgi:hypothetical protein